MNLAVYIYWPISPTHSNYKYSSLLHHHHQPTQSSLHTLKKKMKVSFAVLLLLALLFTSAYAISPAPSPSRFGCDKKCALRCSKSGWKDRCLKYCGICCGKCNGCVPSGPYAPKAQCPCYRDMKNPKGRDKCP
ncbi:putative gibberellin regulated protein [Helianthus annuus]|nr:putative gibberellin regulated protein [Helianthus annuus]